MTGPIAAAEGLLTELTESRLAIRIPSSASKGSFDVPRSVSNPDFFDLWGRVLNAGVAEFLTQ